MIRSKLGRLFLGISLSMLLAIIGCGEDTPLIENITGLPIHKAVTLTNEEAQRLLSDAEKHQ